MLYGRGMDQLPESRQNEIKDYYRQVISEAEPEG